MVMRPPMVPVVTSSSNSGTVTDAVSDLSMSRRRSSGSLTLQFVASVCL